MKKLATTLTMCALLFPAAACADAEKSGPAPAKSPSDAASPAATDGEPIASPSTTTPTRFAVTKTSWDVTETPAQGPTPPPLVITWEEGKRQKFERDASERWQNTEIFVRKRQ